MGSGPPVRSRIGKARWSSQACSLCEYNTMSLVQGHQRSASVTLNITCQLVSSRSDIASLNILANFRKSRSSGFNFPRLSNISQAARKYLPLSPILRAAETVSSERAAGASRNRLQYHAGTTSDSCEFLCKSLLQLRRGSRYVRMLDNEHLVVVK
jgi:hypothetical protein